jgi:hypothetical protein
MGSAISPRDPFCSCAGVSAVPPALEPWHVDAVLAVVVETLSDGVPRVIVLTPPPLPATVLKGVIRAASSDTGMRRSRRTTPATIPPNASPSPTASIMPYLASDFQILVCGGYHASCSAGCPQAISAIGRSHSNASPFVVPARTRWPASARTRGSKNHCHRVGAASCAAHLSIALFLPPTLPLHLQRRHACHAGEFLAKILECIFLMSTVADRTERNLASSQTHI